MPQLAPPFQLQHPDDVGGVGVGTGGVGVGTGGVGVGPPPPIQLPLQGPSQRELDVLHQASVPQLTPPFQLQHPFDVGGVGLGTGGVGVGTGGVGVGTGGVGIVGVPLDMILISAQFQNCSGSFGVLRAPVQFNGQLQSSMFVLRNQPLASSPRFGFLYPGGRHEFAVTYLH